MTTGYIFRTTPLTNDQRTGYLFAADDDPSLESLSPATAAVAASVTLHVIGENFTPGSIIEWAGTQLATTFVSETELTASPPTTGPAGTREVKVRVNDYVRTGGEDFTLT